MSQPPDWKNIQIEELALIIGKQLDKHGVDAVLVGGACVSIYSSNRYMSGDLDYISYDDHKKIEIALEELGFVLEQHKYFTHPKCTLFLEFLSPPVAIGNKPVTQFNKINNPIGKIKLLTPTDCVKDRLAAYYHWNDRQSLDQAVMVAQTQKVNMSDIERWSKSEGHEKKYRQFKVELKKNV